MKTERQTPDIIYQHGKYHCAVLSVHFWIKKGQEKGTETKAPSGSLLLWVYNSFIKAIILYSLGVGVSYLVEEKKIVITIMS